MNRFLNFFLMSTAAVALAGCAVKTTNPETDLAINNGYNQTSNTAVQADIVLSGGYIYTVDKTRSVQDAIAIKDGHIIAIGSNSDIAPFIGPITNHRNLNGKMVMPGLHDMHIHALSTIAPEACDIDSTPMTLDTIVTIIQGCIEQYNIAEGDWVPVMQWNPYEGNQPSKTHPTLRAALDAASRKNPVVLLGNDGHHYAANSMAMHSITPALSAQSLANEYSALAGLVEVDTNGIPTGGLSEGAGTLVSAKAEKSLTIPAPTLMPKVARLLASRGITSIQDAMVNKKQLAQYQWLERNGDMTFRVRTSLHYLLQNGHAAKDLANVPAMIDEIKKMRASVSNSRYINANATKLFADGVMEGNPYGHPPTQPVAAMLKPYNQPLFKYDPKTGSAEIAGYVDQDSAICRKVRDNPDAYTAKKARQTFETQNGFLPKQCQKWSGTLEHSESLLKAYVQQATDAGFHVHVHAIAEKAVKVVADAFELANPSADRQGLSQSLAHVQYAQFDDLKRLGKLGAYITYTYYWILPSPDYEMTVIPFIDPVKNRDDLYNPAYSYMQRAYAIKSAMNDGVIPVFGSDAPVDSRDPRPFKSMQQALTREGIGVVMNPSERLNIHEAIASYTINSAGMMARASELGSLEVGKLADLIVIDQNIVKLFEEGHADKVGNTQVITTIFDGKIVYNLDQ
jgi:predicted amidohydrolase YtcJ